MSGREEEPERDIPICPRCGRKPDFWILYPITDTSGRNGWYWLFSDEYMKKHNRFKKAVLNKGSDGRRPKLNDIIYLVCRLDGGGYHSFGVEDPIFQKVLRQTERYTNEW
jgi:hypothetical protein